MKDQDQIDTLNVRLVESAARRGAEKLRVLAGKIDDAVAASATDDEYKALCAQLLEAGAETNSLAGDIEKHVRGRHG